MTVDEALPWLREHKGELLQSIREEKYTPSPVRRKAIPKPDGSGERKLGIPADQAYQWGNSRLGYWRLAGSQVLKCSITNEKLAQAGYFDFPAHYELIRKQHLCD